MIDLIRCGAYSFNLIINDRVMEVNKFVGMNDMMYHIQILKAGPDEEVQPYIELPIPPE